ncbi:MAG: type II toxin-antitoxin system RelE/ParE family toxin [Treponema sp.]|jgi:proteic killer suppression protein|nr:type II toxin-antitoxin system RelE/ParE family toxin [Treponema sp.]
MIRSFRHKGLEQFFFSGTKRGIIPAHADKLERILDRLDASLSPNDMNLPGYRLHELSGRDKGVWSVTVNGNWRVTFRFEETDAHIVDYLDYH